MITEMLFELICHGIAFVVMAFWMTIKSIRKKNKDK